MDFHSHLQRCCKAKIRKAGQPSMKNFLRLLRYGLPYTLEWLPGVVLSAFVGMLDAFRILLLQPIFDRVLRPSAPEGPIVLGLAKSPWHFDLRMLVPHFLHLHNAWDGRGLRAGRRHGLEGPMRLHRELPGELRRLRHHHRSAQSSLRNHDAPLLELLPQESDRHDSFHAHQRRGPRANRAELGARRFSAAVLHVCGRRLRL